MAITRSQKRVSAIAKKPLQPRSQVKTSSTPKLSQHPLPQNCLTSLPPHRSQPESSEGKHDQFSTPSWASWPTSPSDFQQWLNDLLESLNEVAETGESISGLPTPPLDFDLQVMFPSDAPTPPYDDPLSIRKGLSITEPNSQQPDGSKSYNPLSITKRCTGKRSARTRRRSSIGSMFFSKAPWEKKRTS